MKSKMFLLSASLFFIFPVADCFAADSGFEGWVEVGGMLTDDDNDAAKAAEYEDIGNNFLGNFSVDWFQDAYYFEGEGSHIGLKDQSYTLQGGDLNSFGVEVYYDEILHNLSLDAGTFYTGVGSDTLNIVNATPAREETWSSFDYEIQRQKYGVNAEFLKSSPFFIKMKVSSEEMEGQRPLGTGSFSGAVELPEPVDYRTNNLAVMGGYRSEEISVKLTGMYSTFDNSHDDLEWRNPFTNSFEQNSLPIDSDYAKFGGDLSWRQLPMQSALLVKGSYTNLSGDIKVSDLRSDAPFGLNTTTFDGDISTMRFSTSLVSMPLNKLTTRLYYEFYDRDNDSTEITYSSGSNEEYLLDYQKNKAGLEAGYRIPGDNKLSGGYRFENVDRSNRPDADSNTDNTLFAKVENNSIESVVASVQYTYLNRSTDTDFDMNGIDETDPEYINQFVSRFDYCSKDKHSIKFAVAYYPVEDLNLGASYSYVTNDYDDVVLGRDEDTGHEFYVDFVWQLTRMLKLNGFAGYETYESDSTSYNHRAGFEGQTANPTVEDGSNASYVWSQSVDEDFWTVGLGAEVPLVHDQLTLSLSGQYQKSDGQVDFDPASFSSIEKFEDYYITTLETRVKYALNESITFNVGYQYRKSNYDDAQYDNYDATTGGTYLSGAYADNDYDVHIGYLTMRYSF